MDIYGHLCMDILCACYCQDPNEPVIPPDAEEMLRNEKTKLNDAIIDAKQVLYGDLRVIITLESIIKVTIEVFNSCFSRQFLVWLCDCSAWLSSSDIRKTRKGRKKPTSKTG
jgi:hypothetical protein